MKCEQIAVIKLIKDSFSLRPILESVPAKDIDKVVQYKYADSENSEEVKFNLFNQYNDTFEAGSYMCRVLFNDEVKEKYNGCYIIPSGDDLSIEILNID